MLRELLYKKKTLETVSCYPMETAHSAMERMSALLPSDHVIINSCFNPVIRPKFYSYSPKELHGILLKHLRKAGIEEYESLCCVEYLEYHNDKNCLNQSEPHLHSLIAIHESKLDLINNLDTLLNRRFGATSSLSNKTRSLQGSAFYNTEQIEQQQKQSIEPIYFHALRQVSKVKRSFRELNSIIVINTREESIVKPMIKTLTDLSHQHNSTFILFTALMKRGFAQLIKYFDDS